MPVELRFIQQEHLGGFRDCWAVANLSLILVPNVQSSDVEPLNFNYSKIILCDTDGDVKNNIRSFFHPAIMEQLPSFQQQDIDALFCEDSASIPREFIAQFGRPSTAQCEEPVIKDPPIYCGESDLRM